MRHLILGGGNLGLDLGLEAENAEVCTKSRGFDVFDYPDLLKMLRGYRYDAVWYCVGAGSVTEAKKNQDLARLTYLGLPVWLAENSGTKLVIFSSDYAANEAWPDNPKMVAPNPHKSYYAELKCCEEYVLRLMNKPGVAIVRVGSLYGVHKPWTTFPGRLIKNHAGREGGPVALPSNLVTPTPTRWLAKVLMQNLDKLFSNSGTTINHVAPVGNVTVREWGKLIMPDANISSIEFYDQERPKVSRLGNSLCENNENWHDLWQKYYVKDTPV